MPRIRTLKPSFWSDAKVVSLSRDARLLLVAMISYSDDAGRFVATPAALRGYAFPFDRGVTDAMVARWRDEIAQAKLVQLYSADGLDLGAFSTWGRHQRINRPSPSSLPGPP